MQVERFKYKGTSHYSGLNNDGTNYRTQIVTAVGFVLKETEDDIHLIMGFNNFKQDVNTIAIPKDLILERVKYIAVPDLSPGKADNN